MKKSKTTCTKSRCDEAPFLGGLCKEHAEEDRREELLRRVAISLLERGSIDGELISNSEIKDEVKRICDWWHRVCHARNAGVEDPVLLDETHYGIAWCIAIAKELYQSEIAYRNEEYFNEEHSRHLRKFTWDRFESLEKGLMSNGIPRPKK
jgi:hypothetical protein